MERYVQIWKAGKWVRKENILGLIVCGWEEGGGVGVNWYRERNRTYQLGIYECKKSTMRAEIRKEDGKSDLSVGQCERELKICDMEKVLFER